jgi:outer membrane protein OmpA-like peptidoglycan-associated protein
VLDTVKAQKITVPTEAPVKKATTLKSFFANGQGTQTFVMDDVCFPKNTHKMSGASIAQIPRIAKMLKENPNAKLTIHGYSEKGEKADLWMCSDGQKRDLAATRARCLYQRLIDAGAKASQLDFIGHLDEASPNNTSCPYRGLDLEVTK